MHRVVRRWSVRATLAHLVDSQGLGRSAAQPVTLGQPSRCYGIGSHVSNNDPEVLKKALEREMKGTTVSHFPEEAPGWSEALASDSEAIVKAERRTTKKTFKEMQEETVEIIKEEEEEEGDQASSSTGPAA